MHLRNYLSILSFLFVLDIFFTPFVVLCPASCRTMKKELILNLTCQLVFYVIVGFLDVTMFLQIQITVICREEMMQSGNKLIERSF